jgi:hypothetical protein
MLEDPDHPAPQGAFPVWSKVFTKPGEQTFLEITAHPDAKARSAYIWVFLAGTLTGLINSLTQFVVTFAQLRRVMPEGGGIPGSPGLFGAAGLLSSLCVAPLTGLFSVIGFAISVAIFHAASRFFGGKGTFDRLAYAFGAITVPVTLISGFMIPLNAIPYVLFCTGPLLIALSFYVLYLQVAAIKAVHGFGWGEAAGAYFMPAILIGLLCGVLVLVAMRMIGPSIGDVFRQIQQGIP